MSRTDTLTMTAPIEVVRERGRSRPRRLPRALLGALAVVLALVWVFPVYWMLNSSLLPGVVLEKTTPTLLPIGGSFKNFASVFSGGSFFQALGISLAVAGIAVVCCLLFAFLAALAISRFRFKGRRSFVLAVLFIQMLPAEGMFIAQYKLMGSLGLLNSIIGVSIIYIAAVVPFTIWMLRGFVAGIPAELEEAAMVDGLSRTQAFLRITFPLLAPGLVASGVYAFLQAWNEFTVALVILQDSNMQTLPLWLRGFIQQSASRAIDWGEVMAASTLVAVPVIIFFMFVQGRMTSGLVSGAVKG
ncbi:carbohydrate ABC transporter permease [Leucobacter luti]|uniref:Carbohydrate ABC transporter membrane protein 2 (CUT1 family) n=1 Tax=Leucobacter luti TaxID=340320 RepID=A0A4R6RWI0_9MICO|nr:carbohydrate ABC transporter permease [Leucobacter luti]MCW2289674.1 N,N'-diacetylchitobiose transport system permease protein [Leucobacter luti]QYM77157.1 carbohydrate ABC transporter permease [Leucobacter luti]TCK37845.1 carbohydrate ABC transporter membrane protein 2 (CUT1 family) [Leucobacter luti]TDP90837.1 carbohydrate ABC transporter membrane protein 2 (CUT1 family) [Leucobacter luti]